DEGILADAHEIDMDGEVADGIELHAARDHARLFALDVESEDGALEVARMELLGDGAIVDGDVLGLLFVAIKGAGDAALAARGSRPAFAGARTPPCLEFDRFSHFRAPELEIMRGRKTAPHGRAGALRCRPQRIRTGL